MYSRVTRGPPKGGVQDDIDEFRLGDRKAIDFWEGPFDSPAMPMSTALLPTEIAPVSVRDDVRVASIAPDLAVAPMSPAAEPDPGLLAQQDTFLIRLDQMRTDPRFNWLDGRGVSVVVIDTGIDLNHSFFGNRIAYSYDFSGSNDPNASDWHGHGSNVASIIGSQNGTYTGMAPGVRLIALKVFPDFSPSYSSADVAEALNWVVANRAAYNVVAVNMSLGEGGNYNSPTASLYASQLANLVANNTAVVVASGNRYATYEAQGVSSPSSDPNAWSIGAVWDRNAGGPYSWSSGAVDYVTGPDRIVSFSQRSSTMTTIFAPGGEITGADWDGGLSTFSGTSQAAPHIAGLVADMQQLALGVSGRLLSLGQLEQTMINGSAWIFDGDDENDNVVNTFTYYRRVDALGWATQVLNTLFAGTTGADVLSGTQVGDTIHGNSGNDALNGQGGNDALFGDAGNDFLNGSRGSDTLVGGSDSDTFYFAGGNGWDVVNDFSHAQADRIDVTSFLGIHSFVQALSRATQFNADTIIDFANGDGVTLRNVARSSLVASDFTFLPVTTIESVGMTSVVVVANTYFLDSSAGFSGPQLRTGGGPVVAGPGPWTLLGAEQVGSGYKVVWEYDPTNQYAVWTTDGSGNFRSSSALLSGSSYAVQSLEPLFQQDLNGDGTTGLVSTVIESSGSTSLATVSDFYFLYQGAGTSGSVLHRGGEYVVVGPGPWMPLGAEQGGSGYQVVWEYGPTNQYAVWTTDGSGDFRSSSALLSGSSYAVQSLEPLFQQDLNGDGTTGLVSTVIESSGSTSLATVSDFYFLYQGTGTSGSVLHRGGEYVVVGPGPWMPLGAEQVGSGYQVVWEYGPTNQYAVWTTDGSGNFRSSSALLSGSSYAVQSLEPLFQQDLNGDGTTGLVSTVIETSGSTSLATVSDFYFLYQGAGTSGVVLYLNGEYVVAGSGPWMPLGAEQVGSGYQVVWKNGSADQYSVWTTDGSGNFLSSSAAMSGASATLQAYEVLFQQDFNGNQGIGSSEAILSFVWID